MSIPSFRFSRQGIVLRAFEPSDVGALCAYLNAPELVGRRYLPDDVPDVAPLSSRQVERVLEHWLKEAAAWTLAVIDAESDSLVGHVRADWEWDPHCPSTCVVVGPEHQRRGIGSNALALAVDFLFGETPAHVVSAWALSWNESALAFAAHCGFSEAGRRPRGGIHEGHYYDEVAFDLLRREWVSRKEGRRAS